MGYIEVDQEAENTVPLRQSIKLAMISAAAVLTHGATGQVCPNYQGGAAMGTVAAPNLVEASGLAASRRNAGVIWANNDSGDSARLFALNADGTHLGIYNFSGATATDWEDIAIGSGINPELDYLYVGDIGDNLNIRSTIKVYRVAEPTVSARQSPTTVTLTGVQTITLAYPDGPRDAETLMVDTNGDIYIVSKRVTAQGRVYRAPYPQATSGTITMQFVAQLPWGAVNGNGGATGGDISADGSAIIVRRLSGFSPAATLWRRAPGTNLWDAFSSAGCNLTFVAERQGEAVCFLPSSLSFCTLSEGANQPLYLYSRIPKPGDVTGDDIVNANDLLAVINAWGPCAPCPADLTDDGQVNVNDLLAVINGWG